jgi:hypothetical protein
MAATRHQKSSHPGSGQMTTDHNIIRQWTEERGGHPSTVKGTGGQRRAGLLRIDFPGYRGKNTLQVISWDEFFQKFDEKGLAFIYQDKTATGKQSRFCKLVNREESK